MPSTPYTPCTYELQKLPRDKIDYSNSNFVDIFLRPFKTTRKSGETLLSPYINK